MEDALPKIRKYLDQSSTRFRYFIETLVRAESPSLVPSSQIAVQSLITDQLRRLDYDVIHIPGQTTGGHLYAKPRNLNPRQPKQLLLGHTDTVWPLGTLKEMPLVVKDNIMRGPGVYDMKAGIAMMIFALAAIRYAGLKPSVSPFLFLTSDEELGSPESMPRIKQLAMHMNRVFVLEPSMGKTGRLKTARKGVGQFNITAYGWASHAGLDPDRGASAIVGMSNVIQQLVALNDREKGISVNVGTVRGGERANMIAPECSIDIDVRVPTVAAAKYIEKAIYSITPNVPIVVLDIQGKMNRLPLERTPRNRALWEIVKDIGLQMDVQFEETMAGGGSDGNITSQYTATLDGLGAVGDGAHARHEFIYLDKLVERTTLLAMLLLQPHALDYISVGTPIGSMAELGD